MHTDSEAPVQDSNARLSIQHRVALLHRGLTDLTIEAAGFRSLTAEGVLGALKFNLNKSAGPNLDQLVNETVREVLGK